MLQDKLLDSTATQVRAVGLPALHAKLRVRLLARRRSCASTRGLQLAPAEDSLRASTGRGALAGLVSGGHAASCTCTCA